MMGISVVLATEENKEAESKKSFGEMNGPVDPDKLTAKEKALYLLKNKAFQMCPVALLFGIANGIYGPVFTELQKNRVCQVIFNYSASFCADLQNISHGNEANQVRTVTTDYVFYNNIVAGVPAIVFALFMGAWSDHFGRRIPMMSVFVGMIMSSVFLILFSHIVVHPAVLLVATANSAVLGGQTVFVMATLSYVGDHTSVVEAFIRIQGYSSNAAMSVMWTKEKYLRTIHEEESRRPFQGTLMPTSIFIGGLPHDTLKQDVIDALRPYVEPVNVSIFRNVMPKDRKNSVYLRHAVVKLASEKETQDLLKTTSRVDLLINGARHLNIGPAYKKPFSAALNVSNESARIEKATLPERAETPRSHSEKPAFALEKTISIAHSNYPAKGKPELIQVAYGTDGVPYVMGPSPVAASCFSSPPVHAFQNYGMWTAAFPIPLMYGHGAPVYYGGFYQPMPGYAYHPNPGYPGAGYYPGVGSGYGPSVCGPAGMAGGLSCAAMAHGYGSVPFAVPAAVY
ncbi:uncharacterized protein LOC129591949 isoform X2 [Paramacrobiotus metropolitanus]|nr:uncharacterized protein LOC129591949 isoform X2 [Paramacrobiotus metropolitanus]